MTSARWGALLILALVLGGWSGSVVGAPPGGVVAQTTGTSSSGASGGGGSGSPTGGDDGSEGDGEGGSEPDAGEGSDETEPEPGEGSGETEPDAGEGPGGTGGEEPAPTTAPPDVPEDAIAEGEETDCGGGADPGERCYEVEQVDGVQAVRVPDGKGGTMVVAVGDAPQVHVDSGASTSASSNVDVRVHVDNGDVIRVERRVDPVRQFAAITIAALLGVFVGAAVLGTYLRFRNGPKTTP